MSADAYTLASSTRCFPHDQPNPNPNQQQQHPAPTKKRRNLPGTPDPEAEVIALSPKTLMATNRFVCEVCGKGFQREQNLQLHRRGHNLPWKLRQRSASAPPPKRKVYVCPEESCVHHDPARALGDLTGVKKHFSRKHGEKRWKCERCQKRYAVKSDWKAHSKTCGTKEYKCDCGTIFSRKDSFITHRAFCDALTEESARLSSAAAAAFGGDLGFKGNSSLSHNVNSNPHLGFGHDLLHGNMIPQSFHHPISRGNYVHGATEASQDGGGSGGSYRRQKTNLSLWLDGQANNGVDFTATSSMGFPELLQTAENVSFGQPPVMDGAYGGLRSEEEESRAHHELGGGGGSLAYFCYNNQNQQTNAAAAAHMSATALLQKAAQMGATTSNSGPSSYTPFLSGFGGLMNSAKASNLQGAENKNESQQQNFHQGLVLNNNVFFGEMAASGAGVSTAPVPPPSIPSKVNPWAHGVVGGGLTRDFLGLGGEESDHHRPFLQQELAKFASMAGSGMDLMGSSYSTGKF